MPRWVVVAHLVVEAETPEEASALAARMLTAPDAAGSLPPQEASQITRRVVSSIEQLPEATIRRRLAQAEPPPTQ
jgi:hypothetical protein